jgi:hypothetical protein
VLLSRGISIPSRKVLKSPSLLSLCSYGFPDPGTYRFKCDSCFENVKGRTHPVPAMPQGSLVCDP